MKIKLTNGSTIHFRKGKREDRLRGGTPMPDYCLSLLLELERKNRVRRIVKFCQILSVLSRTGFPIFNEVRLKRAFTQARPRIYSDKSNNRRKKK